MNSKYSQEIAVVPARQQALVVYAESRVLLEATLGGFEEIEREVTKDGEVLAGVACTDTAFVFAECDIKDPVELVFDSPVSS